MPMNLLHSCRQVAELLTLSQDECLRWHQVVRLRIHLTMCSNCKNVALQLAEMQQLSRDLFSGGNDDTEAHESK